MLDSAWKSASEPGRTWTCTARVRTLAPDPRVRPTDRMVTTSLLLGGVMRSRYWAFPKRSVAGWMSVHELVE